MLFPKTFIVIYKLLLLLVKCDDDVVKIVFVVRAGRSNPRHHKSVEREIEKTISHPDYEDPKFYFDVAIAILKQEFQFSHRISSICLPENSYDSIKQFEDDGVTVQGWSVKFEDYDLKEIDVNIKSLEECNHKYDLIPEHKYNYYLPNKLKPSQFCAGNYDVNVRTYY